MYEYSNRGKIPIPVEIRVSNLKNPQLTNHRRKKKNLFLNLKINPFFKNKYTHTHTHTQNFQPKMFRLQKIPRKSAKKWNEVYNNTRIREIFKLPFEKLYLSQSRELRKKESERVLWLI